MCWPACWRSRPPRPPSPKRTSAPTRPRRSRSSRPRRRTNSLAGPARFFRIQDVLDAGGGKDLRIATLGDTQSDAIGLRGSIASLTGTEPFGLFAFRAPEGILWQKWRALEAEFADRPGGDRTLPRRRRAMHAGRAPPRRAGGHAQGARRPRPARRGQPRGQRSDPLSVGHAAIRRGRPLALAARRLHLAARRLRGLCDREIFRAARSRLSRWSICVSCWCATARRATTMRCWRRATTAIG